jgi:hypothetical protein
MDFMSRLEMVLSLLLVLSLGINVVLFIYSRNVTARLTMIADEIGDLRQAATSFASHVRSVYELEMFYGDQTLQALMDHAGAFRVYMDEFDYVYLLDEQEQDEDEETQEEV